MSVSRQLHNCTLQALESAPRVAKAASESLLRRRPIDGTPGSVTGGNAPKTRGDGRTGPIEEAAETLYQIRSVVKKLRPQEVREALEAVRTEAVNVVSRFVRVGTICFDWNYCISSSVSTM